MFIEKIITLLNCNSSYSSIIIPDSLCLIDYYAKLRSYLLKTANLDEIIELGDGVFEEATVPAIILSVSLPKREKNIIRIGCRDAIESYNNKRAVLQESYYITPKNSFNLYADGIFFKIQGLQGSDRFDKLHNILDIKIGICTG